MTAATAVAAAQVRLNALRDKAIDCNDGMIARMAALGPRFAAGPDWVALDETYALANAVFGTAGLFGFESLGQVAYSLCELIDRLRIHRVWHPLALQLHLDSLLLARSAAGSIAPSVMDGLRLVVERVVAWEASP